MGEIVSRRYITFGEILYGQICVHVFIEHIIKSYVLLACELFFNCSPCFSNLTPLFCCVLGCGLPAIRGGSGDTLKLEAADSIRAYSHQWLGYS